MGAFSLAFSNMKVIAIFLALTSVAFAAPRDDDCMVCTEKVGMLWKEMSAEKHEMEMEKAIIKQVCGHEKDPSQCTMLVKQYWPMVAKAMFSDMTAKMVCEGLSYCDMKRSGDDFDCDTCKSGVMAMGQLLTSDDAANEAVTMLQGKAFCQDPGMGLSGDDLKMCQDYIANYIPKILKHMFNGFEKEKRAEMVCKDLFKVCPK